MLSLLILFPSICNGCREFMVTSPDIVIERHCRHSVRICGTYRNWRERKLWWHWLWTKCGECL